MWLNAPLDFVILCMYAYCAGHMTIKRAVCSALISIVFLCPAVIIADSMKTIGMSYASILNIAVINMDDQVFLPIVAMTLTYICGAIFMRKKDMLKKEGDMM